MQTVQLRFTYTEAEYLNASRLLILRETRIVLRLAVLFVLFLLVALSLMVLVPELSYALWTILLTLLAFVAIVFKAIVDMPRRYFRGNENMREEFLLTFSPEGVWVRTSKIDSKMAWSLYTRVLENSSMYVVVYGKDARMMTAVPKRVFRSAQEEVEFRNLLRQHVDDRLPLTTPCIAARTTEYIPSGSQPPDWR